jgi:hypothetical protein
MPNDRTEYLLDEIGRLLAEDVAYPLDGTLLYAVLDTNYVAPSIFKDRGDHILYRSPDLDRLGEALLDLWEAEEADERWTEIEYVVRAGRFEATYNYLDEIDPDEEPLDRRRRIVAQHFGNKPIVYPPSGGEEGAIQFRL